MKHAFLIIAHDEPEVLALLLRQLDDTSVDIYLHLDRRAVAMRQRFAAWRPQRAGYVLLDAPFAVCWGDVSQVDVELRLFQTAYERGQYAYYHLLSGTDLLLRPVADVCAFFDAHAGCEFVHFWQGEGQRRDVVRKVSRYYLFTRHMKDKGTAIHAFVTPIRNIFLAIQKLAHYHRHADYAFQKGSNWGSITSNCCGYILANAHALRRRLQNTLCADEIFLQTLLWASPFRTKLYDTMDNIEKASLRRIDWLRGSPYVWQMADYEDLMTGNALFARKFSGRDTALLHAIATATIHDKATTASV